MAGIQWIKLDIDMFNNRKIKYLRRLPDGNSILLIWIMLLTMAGRCNAAGYIFLTEDFPYDSKMLADELGFEESTIRLALEALSKLGMVYFDDNKLLISDWENHQNIDGMEKVREQTRLRNIEYRQRKKQKQIEQRDATVTSRDGIEEERDKNKNKKEDIEEEGEEESPSPPSFELENEFSTDRQTAMGGELGKGVVRLTEAQTADLLNKLSLEEFNHYVSVIAECEIKGKRYAKSHYLAILDMAEHDRRIQ